LVIIMGVTLLSSLGEAQEPNSVFDKVELAVGSKDSRWLLKNKRPSAKLKDYVKYQWMLNDEEVVFIVHQLDTIDEAKAEFKMWGGPQIADKAGKLPKLGDEWYVWQADDQSEKNVILFRKGRVLFMARSSRSGLPVLTTVAKLVADQISY
jgi:hypothetical protein